MSRPLRIEYPGAVYHVISRGNAGQDIFITNHDRQKFLHWLEDTVKIHNLLIHAYCLMGSHYHLLVETPDGNLSKAMRDLNGNYTQSFNYFHERKGHLMQGRYKAYVIEKEAYLLEVARYIVLNPVRAGLVAHPNKWAWSSYAMTAGKNKSTHWFFSEWILDFFAANKTNARHHYKKYIQAGIDAGDPHQEAVNGFLLGGSQFVHRIWEQTNGSEELREYPRKERVVGRLSLKEIFEDVKTKQDRDDAIKFARFRCGYLASEIAREVNLERSVVSRISRGIYNIRKISGSKSIKARNPT